MWASGKLRGGEAQECGLLPDSAVFLLSPVRRRWHAVAVNLDAAMATEPVLSFAFLSLSRIRAASGSHVAAFCHTTLGYTATLPKERLGVLSVGAGCPKLQKAEKAA